MLVNLGRAAKELDVKRSEIKQLVKLGTLPVTLRPPYGTPTVDLDDLARIASTCRACGRRYFVGDAEYDSLMRRKRPMPTRCRACRCAARCPRV